MFDFVDIYEPDEILFDIDSTDEEWQDDELEELSFENGKNAAKGLAFLKAEFDYPEELFALG